MDNCIDVLIAGTPIAKQAPLLRDKGKTPSWSVTMAKAEHKKDVIGKPEFVEVPPLPISKELKRRWSHFIQKVYETDPLICPKCRGEM